MKTLLEKLDSKCPQGFTTEGATLFFRANLSTREVKRAFDLFPVIAQIESPRRFWLRKQFVACAHHPDCGAARALHAIKSAV